MSGKGKQATRGQKQIYEENNRTIIHYLLASLISAGLLLAFNLLLVVDASSARWSGWVIGSTLQALAVGAMLMMAKSVRNEKKVVDAGADLNDPQAFGEYCKDTVILCSLVHLLSILSAHFYWLLVLLPVCAFYKLWTSFLAPWFFAPSMGGGDGADGVDDGKKSRRREKKVAVRR